MQVTINRQPLGVEDLAWGVGQVEQTRGKTTQLVTLINAGNMPFDGSRTLQEALDELYPVIEQVTAEPLKTALLGAAANIQTAIEKAAEASASASAASLSAGASALSADASEASRVAANDEKLNAASYANEPEDTPVKVYTNGVGTPRDPIEYSAYHWLKKAQTIAGGDAEYASNLRDLNKFGIVDGGFIATVNGVDSNILDISAGTAYVANGVKVAYPGGSFDSTGLVAGTFVSIGINAGGSLVAKTNDFFTETELLTVCEITAFAKFTDNTIDAVGASHFHLDTFIRDMLVRAKAFEGTIFNGQAGAITENITTPLRLDIAQGYINTPDSQVELIAGVQNINATLNYHSAGAWVLVPQTPLVVTDSQYDDGTNLVAIPTSKFVVHTVARSSRTGTIYFIIGNTTYNNIGDAQLAPYSLGEFGTQASTSEIEPLANVIVRQGAGIQGIIGLRNNAASITNNVLTNLSLQTAYDLSNVPSIQLTAGKPFEIRNDAGDVNTVIQKWTDASGNTIVAVHSDGLGYDNTISGLTANRVKEAIDEVQSNVNGTVQTPIPVSYVLKGSYSIVGTDGYLTDGVISYSEGYNGTKVNSREEYTGTLAPSNGYGADGVKYLKKIKGVSAPVRVDSAPSYGLYTATKPNDNRDVYLDGLWYQATNSGELVTNGTFDANVNGWTARAGSIISFDAGRLRSTTTTNGNVGAYTSIEVEAGIKHTINFDFYRGTVSSTMSVRFGTTVDGSDIGNISLGISGDYLDQSVSFTPISSGTVYITFVGVNTTTSGYFTLDNISVFTEPILAAYGGEIATYLNDSNGKLVGFDVVGGEVVDIVSTNIDVPKITDRFTNFMADNNYIDEDAIGANPTAVLYNDGTIVGSTDNGKYTKFSNGIVIQSIEQSVPLTSANANAFGATAGNAYYGDINWTYPIAVLDVLHISGNSTTNSARSSTAFSITITGSTVRIWSKISETANCRAIMIGRWK